MKQPEGDVEEPGVGLGRDGEELVDGRRAEDGVREGEEDAGGLRGGELAGTEDVVVVLEIELLQGTLEIETSEVLGV